MDFVDLSTVNIIGNTQIDRFNSFVEQIKDPYNFSVGDIKVHVKFADEDNGKTMQAGIYKVLNNSLEENRQYDIIGT